MLHPSVSSPASRPDAAPDRENSIAGFVRARRQANGLTQRQLADLAGVGPRAVWDLERGKPTLRMDVANAVLAVFGKRLGLDELPREELTDSDSKDDAE